MASYFSQGNHSCLSSQLELDHDRMSFANLSTGLTKIENLTYRLGYLSSFVSAIEETLEISSTYSLIFRYCSEEVCLVLLHRILSLMICINPDRGADRGDRILSNYK